MSKFDELRKLLDQIVLNEIPDDLSNRVFEIVDEDCQPESFLQLIIDSDEEPIRKKDLFLKGIRELGLEIPSPIDAVRRIVVNILQSIVSGKVTPYKGASVISNEIVYNFSELHDDLYFFVDATMEYEISYELSTREFYVNQIMNHSRELLQKYGC